MRQALFASLLTAACEAIYIEEVTQQLHNHLQEIANADTYYAENATSAEYLVFEDNFDSLDLKKWKHEINMSGGGKSEFQMYENRRNTSWVDGGQLYVKPTLTTDVIAGINITTATHSLWGSSPADACTSNESKGCELTARKSTTSNVIIPPISSASLRTRETFNFKYGRVEVRAQLPKGDWIFPTIGLWPTDQQYGTYPQSGGIQILRSGGNAYSATASTCPNNSTFTSLMHWGQDKNSCKMALTTKSYTFTSPLSDAMHTYGLVWTADRIYTYIDVDDLAHRVLDVETPTAGFYTKGGLTGFNPWAGGATNAPFDQEFYLYFNVAVGGTYAWPDTCPNKPWLNASTTSASDFWSKQTTWYPTWASTTTQSALKVDSVKVWQFSA